MNNDRLNKLAASEKHEASTDQVAIRGKDGGRMGKLTRFAIMPNEKFKALTPRGQEQVLKDLLVKPFWKHCKEIGWWPERRWPGNQEYVIEKQEDGSYVLISYLFKGLKNSTAERMIKSISGTVRVNDQ